MPLIHLVRHGEAAAGFDGHPDPGLSARGQSQAVAVAERLAALGPTRLLSSPLKRAQETAEPLCSRIGGTLSIEPRLSEIPSPTTDLAARSAWLGRIMAGTWTDLPESLQNFRLAIIDCLLAQPEDTIAFSHFVAINLAAGAALDDPRMVVFRPGNTSITTLRAQDGRLTVVSLGAEADTTVN